MALRKLHISLTPTCFPFHASVLLSIVVGLIVAQVAGFCHPVTSSVVVEREGMSPTSGSFTAQLVKVLFYVEEITYNAFYITFKQEV